MIRLIALLTAAAAALPAPAQDRKDVLSSTYKVEFRIRDGSEAAAKSPRRYTMLIDISGHGTLHVGDRVPVPTGTFQPGAGVNPLVNTQWSYFDRGVNLDVSLAEQTSRIMLTGTIDISTFYDHKVDTPGAPIQPVVGQFKIQIHAAVVVGKPTIVTSIDDPVSQRKYDVEAVVTKTD